MHFDNLSSLITNDNDAFKYYNLLPYNIQRDLINNKDEIHNIDQLKGFVKHNSVR